MKKLFGLEKSKQLHHLEPSPRLVDTDYPFLAGETTSSAAPVARVNSKRARSHDRWSIVSTSEVQPTKPPSQAPVSPRARSPYLDPVSHVSQHSYFTSNQRSDVHARSTDSISVPSKGRKPSSLGILRALDPLAIGDNTSAEDLHTTPAPAVAHADKKEKKSFWERAGVANNVSNHGRIWKDKDVRGREMDREQDKDIKNDEELTKMIRYLTATSSDDWALLLEVCERASLNESNAKEAVRAIRKEFRYGEPPAQLAAARLWALMLRNSSATFVTQSTSRKFLDTVGDLVSSGHTSPVVKERLLEVLAAASYASSTAEHDGVGHEGFRNLWKKVKPMNGPDAGIPFNTEDSMFVPGDPSAGSQPGTPGVAGLNPGEDETQMLKPQKPLSKNKIVSHTEDIRRLMDECLIGSGNAQLLVDALTHAKPSDLGKKDNVIQEFRKKCLSSHELIYAQIPWATATSEHSRKNQLFNHEISTTEKTNSGAQETSEEKLLGALLKTNEELQEALRLYDDLAQLAVERKTQQKSKKDFQSQQKNSDEMSDLHQQSQQEQDRPGFKHLAQKSLLLSDLALTIPSTSIPSTNQSPSARGLDSEGSPHQHMAIPNHPTPSSPSQYHLDQSSINSLHKLSLEPLSHHHVLAIRANEPRSSLNLASSALPSVKVTDTSHDSSSLQYAESISALPSMQESQYSSVSSSSSHEVEYIVPSAKALGKQRLIIDYSYDNQEIYSDESNRETRFTAAHTEDSVADVDILYQPRSIHYVYDAAAERTQQFVQQNRTMDNTVH